MTGAKGVTATFTLAPKAKIGTVGHATLATAYGVAATGDIILLLDSEMPDNCLDINAALGQGKNITLKGGYKADFRGTSGLPTILHGPFKISSGRISVEGLRVR